MGRTMRRIALRPVLLLIVLACFAIAPFLGAAQNPIATDVQLFLQQPTLSQTKIAFVYGDDLWVVDRQGGDAERLTSTPGVKSHPKFSPDGRWIAFTADLDGNKNIYVVAENGGPMRRVTHYPGHDFVTGWSPDGARILFESTRESHSTRYYQLFTIPFAGGAATALPLPMGYQGSFSPDGQRVAFSPIPKGIVFGGGPLLGWQHARWKHYGGGLKPRIWLADLKDSRVEVVPRESSNDFNPMWVGSSVYFLSDRGGRNTLYRYDTVTHATTQVLPMPAVDIESAASGPDAIVYELPGSLRLLDLASGMDRHVPVRVRGDFVQIQPRWTNVASQIRAADLSPSGSHVAFEARGEILVVGTADSQVQNVTRSSGVAERDPVWSPDGRYIAYFSDESGEFALHVRSSDGRSNPRRIPLAARSSHFFRPRWSPDSRRLLFLQARTLWYVTVTDGVPTPVATDRFHTPITEIPQALSADWSPDGEWITYNGILSSGLRALFTYSLRERRSTQITDGNADVETVAFDPSGDLLYFTASTTLAAKVGWLEMSSLRATSTSSVFAVALRRDVRSPHDPAPTQAPEVATASEPTGGAMQGKSRSESTVNRRFSIELDGIADRVVALPVPARHYVRAQAHGAGRLLLLTAPDPGMAERTLYRFELKSLKTEVLETDVTSFAVAARSDALLLNQRGTWVTFDASTTPDKRTRPLSLDSLSVQVDPQAEWQHIFRESLHVHRDALYAENTHGLDVTALERQYLPLLRSIVSRQDLNNLLTLMLGEFSVGHLFVVGGDLPAVPSIQIGMLGADLEIHGQRYRFRRIYRSPWWDANEKAPLSRLGDLVRAGEYLLAIDDQSLAQHDDVFERLTGKVGVPVRLRVGPNPDGSNSREVSVIPIASEFGLRGEAWVADNARRVSERTQGRVGYIYLPDTGFDGMRSFDRGFFAQAGLDGVIIDARFNSGGTLADYILMQLQQREMGYFHSRDAEPMPVPRSAILGPKTLLINEYSASGGDYLPWAFRRYQLGPVIGERTWGGVVSINDARVFIDGGFVTVPEDGFFTPEARWDVENIGVDPDVRVTLEPHAWRAGLDTQLERAIDHVNDQMKLYSKPVPKTPPLPDYLRCPMNRGECTAP